MNNKDDEVTAPPPSDETCVSGLISSVLTLIINILVWLQKSGCKNIPALTDCPETCELLPTLEKLSLFARQADGFEGDSTEGKSCGCPKNCKKEKKEKSDRNLKKAKSGDNHAVLYAVSEEGSFDQDCKKCCKKNVEPKEKKEDDNVIFEVVAAEMVENSTQTDTKESVDCYTQSDEPEPEPQVVDQETEAEVPCICSSTQVSTPDITKVETQDIGVQVEIEIKRSIKSVEDESNESLPPNDSNVKFRTEEDYYACPAPRFEACANDDDDDEEEDYEDEEDEEEDTEPELYLPCPARCVPYAQARQAGYRRPAPSPYIRGQPPMRQERTSCYRNCESHPMYNQYNAGYDPYGPMRYPYQPPAQPQPYYQKVTRTIQRGPAGPRKAEYPNQLQRQTSPTQRPKADNQSNGEKYPQSAPITPPSSPTASVQMNKKESMSQRDQNVGKSKDCVPHCPGNKPVTVRKLSATPVPQQQSSPPPQATPAQQPSPKPHSPVVKKECDPKCPKLNKPVVSEKSDVSRIPSKKCIAKCATGGNANKNQPKTNTQQKPRPVSFMPKGAIPVEPREVFEVEEAPPSKQTILADSVMSVEASKRNK